MTVILLIRQFADFLSSALSPSLYVQTALTMVLLYAVALYFIVGFLFAIPFVIKWVVMVDESTKGTSWSFRLLILPGTIVLWPVLLRKYLKARKEV